ncbi:hypothetical protein CRE_21884 [Caenorhabditis remanei]|uniref:DUF19 domain-containing protein n=1 Tax=Caenorhabditis remanei TaxID=31234 RepID=E3MUG0_CAERE|nr:hypothetical protein CRE_21884 [Caenorhabditis remanei]
MYKFCTGVETLFLEYSTFFEKSLFGTKETLDLDIANVHSTLKTCDRYTLQNQTIQSSELENFVNDFTEDGIAKKCLDMKERSTLMDAFSQECDEEAGRHFKYFLADLKSYYNCSYN